MLPVRAAQPALGGSTNPKSWRMHCSTRLQTVAVDLLRFADRLAAAAEVEAAELDGGAEPFGKIGRVEHRVEQLEQAELQRAGFVDPPRLHQVVQLARDLGDDAAGGVGAALAAHEEHRHERRLPAGEEHEVGADRLDGAHHPHHERDVARAESLMPTTRGNSASRRIVGTSMGLANIGML